MLFILLVLMQYALLFHARSQLNYATFEAARAGTVANARPAAIRTAFDRAMTGYHGGGTTTGDSSKRPPARDFARSSATPTSRV